MIYIINFEEVSRSNYVVNVDVDVDDDHLQTLLSSKNCTNLFEDIKALTTNQERAYITTLNPIKIHRTFHFLTQRSMFLAMISVGSVIFLLFCGQVLSYQVDEIIPPDNQKLSLNSLQVPRLQEIENIEKLITDKDGEPCGLRYNKTCFGPVSCVGFVGRRLPGSKGYVKRGTCQPRKRLGHTCGYQNLPHPNTKFQSFLGECEDEYVCKDNKCQVPDYRHASSCTRDTCTMYGQKCELPFKVKSNGPWNYGCVWGKYWHKWGYWCATDLRSNGVYYNWDWCPFCALGGNDCCTANRHFPNPRDRCLDKHGDCDTDLDCKGHSDLVCGSNNCQGFGPFKGLLGDVLQQCCYDPQCDEEKGFCSRNDKGKCRKTEGQKGCCIFPFEYKGSMYYDCTHVDATGHHTWCATQRTRRDGIDIGSGPYVDSMYDWDNCWHEDHRNESTAK